MMYGITGNVHKEELWKHAASLASWLEQKNIPFKIQHDVAQGLLERGLLEGDLVEAVSSQDLTQDAEIVLSFGGDGTLLRTAHNCGRAETPILGINIGRLGFLADTEVGAVREAITDIENGDYRIEERTVLEVDVEGRGDLSGQWALNEFVLERGGPAGLIAIDVHIDGIRLNRYWADGLIIATPTGSTAYSLASGGPIVMPSSEVMILSPLAPHSLTVRPLVIPETSVVEARVRTDGTAYVLAADGRSTMIKDENMLIRVRRAAHHVCLIKLKGQQYFQTLRTKLMWGADDYRDG